ncbi:iron-sulfur cluster co-chaperone protein HscB, mitochondrial isoform X2 [Oryzias latipes]|uniref:iron-sulfur cluster co-chaperone protein HscB, mitochondrial isoform X2 n=1 Tax=Oryzias latipes TaxID=8090 RepID=UPI0009DB246F|nr:iron-sulfur cluster co-chaperone protein HscB, mitochondrial isoform X2 [Oryzias latipes]
MFLRVGRSSGAVLRSRCLLTGGLLVPKAAWTRNVTALAVGRRRRGELFYYPNEVRFRNCSTSQAKTNCWNCKQLLDNVPAFFCNSCKTIQPPAEGESYFKIMDCDYTFTVDTQKLQRRYLQLQRFLHPDNFSQRSALELEGMHLEEGTDSGADSAFLMRLMEINEAVDEAQTPEEAEEIGRDTRGKLADLTGQIDAALHKGELHAAKALLVQMKYYANIEEKVKGKLSEFM